jgi:hypothetical protein
MRRARSQVKEMARRRRIFLEWATVCESSGDGTSAAFFGEADTLLRIGQSEEKCAGLKPHSYRSG